jgi:hypothetical protein
MLITEKTSPEAIEAALLLLPPGKYDLGNGRSVRIHPNGNRWWYQNSQLHREDGPAFERVNGTCEWYQNGKQHRVGGPAVEGADGTREWWVDGIRHRVDGPAVMKPNGSQEWWINGKRERAKRKQSKSIEPAVG